MVLRGKRYGKLRITSCSRVDILLIGIHRRVFLGMNCVWKLGTSPRRAQGHRPRHDLA